MEVAIDHSDGASFYNDILIQENVILPCINKIFKGFTKIKGLIKDLEAFRFSEEDLGLS